MRKTISRKRKLEEKRGQGSGATYKPWIKAREIPSRGTCVNIVDWKHGRIIETLSLGESILYHILRFDDNNWDIREQYPLDLDTTNAIAAECGIRPAFHGKDNMTTDFLVVHEDGSLDAWSLKESPHELENERTTDKLCIEKLYWLRQGAGFHLVFKSDLNQILADNIRLCVEYFDASRIHDPISLLKHLIAVKKIRLDMESAPLCFGDLIHNPEIVKIMEEAVREEEWKTFLLSGTF